MTIRVRKAPMRREAKRAEKSATPQPIAADSPKMISKKSFPRECERADETFQRRFAVQIAATETSVSSEAGGREGPLLFANPSRLRFSQQDYATDRRGDTWRSVSSHESRT